jgi:hypothetical protein
MSAAALLFLFASGSQTLVDEVFQVPANEWRYVAAPVKDVPVIVEYDFQVISGSGKVRVALVNREGLDDLKGGSREPLGSGLLSRQATFRRVVSAPDEYAVVLENSGRGPASVRLRVSLDFSEAARPRARYLSPERRFAVIVISTTVFLAIVSYSARKLLGVTRT